MKHYEKLIEWECFSRKRLVALLGNAATAESLIREYLKKGYIERVRRDLYAVISLETKQPIASRYGIGCALFPDAILTHHSAYEVYGFANQVFYTVYIATKNRFSDFTYNGITYHRVLPKENTVTTNVNGLHVTSIEQTVVDSIADFEKIAGLEETLRCISLIPELDEQKLIKILTERCNGFLWQKCGYVLSELNDVLYLSENFFDVCRNHKAGSKRQLMQNAPYVQQWDREWGLYVPGALEVVMDKGHGDQDAI